MNQSIAKPKFAILPGMMLAAGLSVIRYSDVAAAGDPLLDAQALSQAVPSDVSQDRRRLVADNLPLSNSEAELFWPLYDRYQKDLSTVVDRRQAIIARLGENYDDMPDSVAKQFITDTLELQEFRIKLMKAYLLKLSKVLPPKKLARYFQIEGRIAVAVDTEIAQRIPLIK